MDAVLLIAGLFVLWLWLKGHPIGAFGVFAVLIGLGLGSSLAAIGYFAVFALAPMTILWLYRDLKKGRGGLLAYFGDRVLTDLGASPAPQAQKLEGRCWTKEVIQAHFDNYSWSKADLEVWAGAPAEQLARQGLAICCSGWRSRSPVTAATAGLAVVVAPVRGLSPRSISRFSRAPSDQPYERPLGSTCGRGEQLATSPLSIHGAKGAIWYVE